MRDLIRISIVRNLKFLIVGLGVGWFGPIAPFGQLVQAAQPNVVVLLADDLGYSDLGCYGGEIETPNIDGLAAEGVRFTHFRASPMCVTSRIAMLSGMSFHRAGGNAYSHSLPLPMLLKTVGYRTLMTGKWHAGVPDPRSRAIFDRSFGFLGGMTDSFVGTDDWFIDDQPFQDFEPGFYSTDAFADRGIEFMKEAVSMQQPFFMYVAFNAPHHPCQAPERIVNKYAGRYRDGYEETRRARHQRQIELGIVGENSSLADVDHDAGHWEGLTEHRREVEAGRMAAYAAAVDGVDAAVGRILKYLRDAKLDDNTLVFFMSDNGGDYSNGSIDTDEQQVPWLPGSNPSSSNGWASVKATPFRYYKHSCHEGGIAAPLIVRYPAGTDRVGGDLEHAPASITDLYPTLLELASCEYPDRWGRRTLRSLTGASLVPLLRRGGSRLTPPDFQHYDFSRAWIQDEWKAVNLYGGPWQLFNLSEDRSETRDLATVSPARLEQLKGRWMDHARQAGVPDVDAPEVKPQKGWGWHRLKMVCPSLTKLDPPNDSTCDASLSEIRMTFDREIDFVGTSGNGLRLYHSADESTPVWQSIPDETHLSQGKRELRFTGLPPLRPDQSYYFLWDANWIKVGGQGVGRLNNGAYWWRFRTKSENDSKSVSADAGSKSDSSQPNLVFILADDQGCFASIIQQNRHEKGISIAIFGDFKLQQRDPN